MTETPQQPMPPAQPVPTPTDPGTPMPDTTPPDEEEGERYDGGEIPEVAPDVELPTE